MNLDSIPIDLILEILSRLPAKSIARFHCVSKLWALMLGRTYFKELFLTRSSSQPRLLFAIVKDGLWSFFSLPQPQNPYENSSSSSSLVVDAEFHLKFPPDNMRIYHYSDRQYFSCGYASGLIYFNGMWIKEKGKYCEVICNPNTGRYVILPYLKRYRKSYSFFGFDRIDKQFKVLFMVASPTGRDHPKILTLGTGEMRWREIKCSLRPNIINREGICINGVLYFLGYTFVSAEASSYVIVCFDVKSEKFKFIDVDDFCELINYKGKLGVIYFDHYLGDIMELRVWILEDVEKQEWSKYTYTLRDDIFLHHYVSLAGATTTGEIVLSMNSYTSEQPFYVFYFNPERSTLQRVEIQGFGETSKNHRIYTFVNHVEDLNVNNPKLLKSSIYAPYVKTE